MMDNRVYHEGHRERLKSEYIKNGPDSLSDARALELLLGYSIARKDTYGIAKELIKKFSCLKNVFSASIPDLCTVDGIGEKTALLIKLTGDIYRKSLISGINDSIKVNNSRIASEIVKAYLSGLVNEAFIIIALDSQNTVIRCDTISSGVVNSVSIDVRKSTEFLLSVHATSAIIAHNHPDGNTHPSNEDHFITEKLQSAFSTVGIFLRDHIIYSDSGAYYSFADNNLL